MDESPGGEPATESGATDEDVAAAVSDSEAENPGPDGDDADGGGAPDVGLPDEVLNAPASAEEGDHTLLEEYEREQEPGWKGWLRTAGFWLGATAASVAVTLTAVVSLQGIGLQPGLAFVLGSAGMAVMVGLVFLSLQQ